MPHVPVAVCLKCSMAYQIKRNGMTLQAEVHNDPYYIVAGDVYRCPGCGHEIAATFGRPLERHSPMFSSRPPPHGRFSLDPPAAEKG